MNLLIVGASGYIGKQLMHAACGLTTTFSTVRGTSSRGADGLLHLDLAKPLEFDLAVIEHSDIVLLPAAISSPDICAREFERTWAVNVTGTTTFISAAIARGARVIFFSSDTVYGEREIAFGEMVPCKPVGEYAVMKHEVESRFLSSPQFKTMRLSYVFSRDDKFTRYLAGCAMRGEEAEVFHPFYRAVIHRDDVVAVALDLARRWDESFEAVINVGGPACISRIEFAVLLRDQMLPTLHFRQIEPVPDFFVNRPRTINMKSDLLAPLLGRPAHTLAKAIQIEGKLP